MLKVSSFSVHAFLRRSAAISIAGVLATLIAASHWLFDQAAAQVGVAPSQLVGSWVGFERAGPITIQGDVIFYPNGSYRRHHAAGMLQTWDSGNYQVAQSWVHFEVQDYEPKTYNGARLAPPPSDTWMLTGFNGRVAEGRIGGATFFHYEKVN
jgi:hypothetical protein